MTYETDNCQISQIVNTGGCLVCFVCFVCFVYRSPNLLISPNLRVCLSICLCLFVFVSYLVEKSEEFEKY